jgi:alkylation response protein AidB-like acyl-CoA dehydrogenase
MTTTSRFLEIVQKLGPRFASRAAAADVEGRFVRDNYADLKEARLMSALVPSELGGGGATHGEVCQVLRELAHHCGSTALALSMHTHLVAAAVWRHKHWPARRGAAAQDRGVGAGAGEHRRRRLGRERRQGRTRARRLPRQRRQEVRQRIARRATS